MEADVLYYLKEVSEKSELKGLDYIRGYKTKNYNLFEKLMGNRGTSASIEKNRVDYFVGLRKIGKYVIEDCHVRVNKVGKIIDGHHHIAEAKATNSYYVFMIIPDKMYNDVTDREFADNVSFVHSHDSSWKDYGNFRSALIANEKCALMIHDIISRVSFMEIFNKNPFTPARVVSIVNNFKTGTKNRKELRSEYCNDEYVRIMETEEFKKRINGIIEFMKIVHTFNKATRSYGIVRQLVIDMNKIPTMNKELDWEMINKALLKYIKKNKKFVYFGDRSEDFKEISKGIRQIIFN